MNTIGSPEGAEVIDLEHHRRLRLMQQEQQVTPGSLSAGGDGIGDTEICASCPLNGMIRVAPSKDGELGQSDDIPRGVRFIAAGVSEQLVCRELNRVTDEEIRQMIIATATRYGINPAFSLGPNFARVRDCVTSTHCDFKIEPDPAA